MRTAVKEPFWPQSRSGVKAKGLNSLIDYKIIAKMTSKCPNCRLELKEGEIVIEEAVKHQCPACHYYKLEPTGEVTRTVKEITGSPLQIKQKITTLSQGRLGLYLNQDVVRSLGLKAGQEVYLSVPDGKIILIQLEVSVP